MSEITRRLPLAEQVRDEWCAEYVKMRARAEKAEAELAEAKAALTAVHQARADMIIKKDNAEAALEAANARTAELETRLKSIYGMCDPIIDGMHEDKPVE
jgi:membrane protein involved in colicin uptake